MQHIVSSTGGVDNIRENKLEHTFYSKLGSDNLKFMYVYTFLTRSIAKLLHV